jgi:hypothetical protein
VSTAFAVAVVASTALGPGDAHAVRVENTFRVDYDVTVASSYRLETFGTVTSNALSYTVRGELPEVRFEDSILQQNVNGTLSTAVEGTMATAFSNPGGTSSSCNGGTTQVTGAVGLGHVTGFAAIWFLPTLSARATGTCQDTDGGTPEGVLTVDPPKPKASGVEGLPPGAQRFETGFAELDSGSWSRPIKLSYTGEECLRHPKEGGSCTTDITGTLRLTRTRRRLVESPEDDMLAPVETPRKPRLDGPKRNGKATVRCPRACDIEATIGVFGQKNGKPHISYPVRRTRRLKAKGSTTVTVPLNARGRRAVRDGTAVMALEVRMGGKRRRATYPLS